MPSPSSILSLGLGNWGSPSDVLTLGYGFGISATFSRNDNYYLEVTQGLSVRLGDFRVPYWNTAGRPSSPVNYSLGYNTDLTKLELWNGSTWITL